MPSIFCAMACVRRITDRKTCARKEREERVCAEGVRGGCESDRHVSRGEHGCGREGAGRVGRAGRAERARLHVEVVGEVVHQQLWRREGVGRGEAHLRTGWGQIR